MEAEPDRDRGPPLGLEILSGLHQGAVIGMTDLPRRLLGSGGDADVLLADEGIAERQCVIVREANGLLGITALAPELRICGIGLAPEQSVSVRVGTALEMGSVRLRVIRLAGRAADGSLGAFPPTEAEVKAAQRHVLRQRDLRRYLWCLATGRTARYAAGALMLAALAGSWAIHALRKEPLSPGSRKADAADMKRLFPAVRVDAAGDQGMVVYEGYVDDQRELSLLRSIALAADQGRSVIRVVPMDVLVFHAAAWLEGYYQDARVEAAGPGELRVTVPSPLSVKRLDAWDVDAMVQRLSQELPSLKSVALDIADPRPAPVAAPAAALGFSVMPLEGGRGYVIGEDDQRLFAGAAVAAGALVRISPCDVRLLSRDAGSLFRLDAGGGACAKPYVPPAPGNASIESVRDAWSRTDAGRKP